MTRSLTLSAVLVAALWLPANAQTDPAAPAAPQPYVPPTTTAPVDAAAAGAAAAKPAADPVSDQIAQSLATQIEDVQVVGPWTDGSASGVWRTVMMQTGTTEKDVYRFFVQKLDRVGPGARLVSSTEIPEIAGVNGAVVGYRADEAEDQTDAGEEGSSAPAASEAKADLTLFFDVVPANGEIPETYELHFMKDQTYTFGPASN